jgi:hypothetical protein
MLGFCIATPVFFSLHLLTLSFGNSKRGVLTATMFPLQFVHMINPSLLLAHHMLFPCRNVSQLAVEECAALRAELVVFQEQVSPDWWKLGPISRGTSP